MLNKEHLDTLISIAEGDPKGFIMDLLDTFKKNWSECIEGIKTACHEKDSDKLREFVHKVSGSSGNVGLLRLSTLCQNIEQKLYQGEFSGYENCVSMLEAEYAASLKGFMEYLDSK